MAKRQGKLPTGLELALISSLILSPAAVAHQIQSTVVNLIPGYSLPSEEACRDALNGFLLLMQLELKDAVEAGDINPIIRKYGTFYDEVLEATFDGMSREQFGLPVTEISNEQLKRLMYLKDRSGNLLRSKALDDLVQRVSIRPEMAQSQRGKLPTFAVPDKLGQNQGESEFRFFVYQLPGYWRVEKVYRETHEPEKDFVRLDFDRENPNKERAPTPDELRIEKRRRQIQENMGKSGDKTQLRRGAGEPGSDLNREGTQENSGPQTPPDQSPSFEDPYDNITSVGVGDIIPNFEIIGRGFDFGISDVFRVRICEADLYKNPLASSRHRFYEFLVLRYCARSSVGLGRSFIEADDLILRIGGRTILSYAPKNSTRHDPGDKMPPLESRNPTYSDAVCKLINGGKGERKILHTNEGSFTSLNVAYLISGPDWEGSRGSLYRPYYAIPESGTALSQSDNGKSVTINIDDAELISLDDLR